MRYSSSPLLVAVVSILLLAVAAGPAGATALGRPTVYADVWGGAYAGGTYLGVQDEAAVALGTAVGAYVDLARRLGGAIRVSYWEIGNAEGLNRRYTGADVLFGPRLGDFRLLAGLSVLDRRDFFGSQGGGWGWRLGGVWERAFRRVVAGAGAYATPRMSLRRWVGGAQLDPVAAGTLEGEAYLVVPLGGAWAVRGGYRGFALGIEETDNWRVEVGQGLFLGATARF